MRVFRIILLLLIISMNSMAVVLPTAPYSGAYSEANTDVLYSETGVSFKGSFVALGDGECDTPGEPTQCVNCCNGKLPEDCSSDPQACADQYTECYNSCMEGHQQLGTPIDCFMAEFLMCASLMFLGAVRHIYRRNCN